MHLYLSTTSVQINVGDEARVGDKYTVGGHLILVTGFDINTYRIQHPLEVSEIKFITGDHHPALFL